MKRYIKIFYIILCVLLAVPACNVVDMENPTPEIPYEIFLVPPTKTANNGLSTVWVDGDKVNVFHAEAGTENYVNDGAFTFSTEDRFTGTIKAELESAWAQIEPILKAIYDFVKKIIG